MVNNIIGELSNRRRTRLGPSCQSWIAAWADDTDSDLRYIGCVVYGSNSEALNVAEVDPVVVEVNPVALRV